MIKDKRPRFGKLPPRYDFVVNPYHDLRFSSCPGCNIKTGQKKVPLLILVYPKNLITLNYTCRYCKACNLLVAHKHEIERYLTDVFLKAAPSVIGNDYLIIGTVKKETWRKGLTHHNSSADIIANTHDFKDFFGEIRVTCHGWYKDDQIPPIRQPLPSRDWVKTEQT